MYSSPFLVASLAAGTATHATTARVALGIAGVVAALRIGGRLCPFLARAAQPTTAPRTTSIAAAWPPPFLLR